MSNQDQQIQNKHIGFAASMRALIRYEAAVASTECRDKVSRLPSPRGPCVDLILADQL
jgi:hypothetical protein